MADILDGYKPVKRQHVQQVDKASACDVCGQEADILYRYRNPRAWLPILNTLRVCETCRDAQEAGNGH